MGKYFKSRIGIEIVVSRPDYFGLLLTSLREQTYQKWDLFIVIQDPRIMDHPIVMAMLYRLSCEGHRFKIIRGEPWMGIGALRNLAVEANDCEYGLRIDDDSVCDSTFIERLMAVMEKRRGIVGGIVPFMKEKQFIEPKGRINAVDADFNISDQSIYFFNTDQEYFDVDHIRSSYMYPSELSKRLKFPTYNDDLGGFREETDFCLRAKFEGVTISLVPDAVCWHLAAPSGGTRPVWMKFGKKAAEVGDKRFRYKMKEYEKNKIQDDNSKGRRRKTKKV